MTTRSYYNARTRVVFNGKLYVPTYDGWVDVYGLA
ncbi:MAG: hypothetical protein WBR28_24015 [Mycobacterium sp.]